MEQMREEEKKEECGCAGCHCFCHGMKGRFSILRIIIGLVLLGFVFCLGIAVGKISGFERGYGRMMRGEYYGGYGPGYMMRGYGYDGYTYPSQSSQGSAPQPLSAGSTSTAR